MIDSRTKLTVLHDDNGVFTDLSNKAADYLRDDFSFQMVAAEDALYVGFRKPVGAAYLALTTPNTNACTLSAEVWNGTAWASVELHDETDGMTRSGFMTWDKSGMNSTTVDGSDKYWLRVKTDTDHSLTTARGLNLVFSDDAMMKAEFFEIDNASLLPSGESSHISTHVAARNAMIQALRNLGYIKENATTGEQNIDQWDLHDIYEIRQAAMYLALSKIFFNLSDSVDDNWWQKYREYQDKHEEAFRLARISMDLDDDGTEDTEEKRKPMQSYRWNR